VSGAAAPTSLIIEGMRLHDAGGSPNADGLQCAIGAASSAPVVILRSITIDGNDGQGVDTNNCKVTVERSTLNGNTGGGVTALGGSVTLTESTLAGNTGGGINASGGSVIAVTQSTLSGNTGGGVKLAASSFVLVNNVIDKNGSISSEFGGVSINGIPPSGAATFQFNTVATNIAGLNLASGVQCTAAAPIALGSSIVFGNVVTGTGSQTSSTNCSWTYSNIGPQAVSGTGNINTAPTFVNEGTNDYHLKPDSAGINAADPAATVTTDIDGDTRPAGGRSDMGADEVP